MTTIIYKIVSDFGECRGFTSGGCSLSVRVDADCDGIFSIGGISQRTEGGKCRISLARLPDGDYTPTFTAKGRVYKLERLRKMGENLTRPPIDLELIAKMLLRIEALETEVRALTERFGALERRLVGGGIFG